VRLRPAEGLRRRVGVVLERARTLELGDLPNAAMASHTRVGAALRCPLPQDRRNPRFSGQRQLPRAAPRAAHRSSPTGCCRRR
jgi:hypothetical protein